MILWEKISHSGGKRWEIQESVDGRTRTIAIVRFEEHADQIVALPGLVNAARDMYATLFGDRSAGNLPEEEAAISPEEQAATIQRFKKALEAYQ